MTPIQTLRLVCSHIVDCEHKTSPIDERGRHFAVGTPAMKGNVIDYAAARRISEETFESWTRRLRPRAGDLLLAREAPVGPVVRVPTAENVAPGQRTVLLRPDSSVVSSDYLYYRLTSSIEQGRLSEKAAGSTVAHLNVADVRTFTLPNLPPVPEQQAIAEVLGVLDDKIAANSSASSLIEDLLATSFAACGLDAEPSSDEDALQLSDVIELNPKVPIPSEDQPVYVDMQKLPVSGVSIEEWSRRPAKGGARFQNGDTLLARITPCLENRKTGYVDFLTYGQVAVGSTEYIVMRSRPNFSSGLSFFLATSPRFRAFAIRHMTGTSGRQRLSASDLAEYRLNAADESALRRFDELAKGTLTLVRSYAAENRVLKETRDALLPLFMSGKLRVRDAEQHVEEVV